MKTNPTELQEVLIGLLSNDELVNEKHTNGERLQLAYELAVFFLSKRESELKDIITEIEKMKQDWIDEGSDSPRIQNLSVGYNTALSDIITKLQERI